MENVAENELVEEPERLLTKTTKDTYEAAYYCKYGAEISSVRTTPVPRNKTKRKGYGQQWIITLHNVPASKVELWQRDNAVEKVSDIVSWRRRVKREVKRLLQNSSKCYSIE